MMLTVRRILNHLVVLLLCNTVCLWQMPLGGFGPKLAAPLLLCGLFVWLNIAPRTAKGLPGKQPALAQGCELLLTGTVCALSQLALSLVVGLVPLYRFGAWVWVLNSVAGLAVIGVLVINGSLRLFFSSVQLSVTRRVLLICLCWWPVLNLANAFIACPLVRREAKTIHMRAERNRRRKQQQICATRYPLLLVHGIFFRDWKHLSYWGRIPDELAENGAVIYFGRQQSSASVEASARELQQTILSIVNGTGCGKVNIIAHSKGGLDARYAVSCLGMDAHVASLTTVSTPHRGCRFARKALADIPDGVVSLVGKNYNRIFTLLGDSQPDFFSGVSELTDEACAALNEVMPNHPGVLYQSLGSKMSSAKSAGFPLNLGYNIVRPVDGDNDGLVSVSSMPWGNFTLLEPAGKTGISHADMIDLTRRDIPGFDVGELYVNLAAQLRAQGL